MKTIMFILALLLGMYAAQAEILKVASNGTQQYSQISAAIGAASPSDTVLVLGGGYSGFVVDKKLVLIGAGTGVGIGEGVLINGTVEVLDNADSTELRSLWIRSNPANGSSDSLGAVLRIRSGATKVFVWRCFVENYSSSPSGVTTCWAGVNSQAEFVQCTFWGSDVADASGGNGVLYRSGSNLTLQSCVFANIERGIHAFSATTGASCLVSHCVFTTENSNLYPVSGAIAGVAENCAIMSESGYSNLYTSGISYSYCAYSNQAPPGATHVAATPAAFVNLVLADARASDYHVAGGSVVQDAGNPMSPFDLDGSRADIGIYGGQHPYVDGGVPDYPFAVQVEVPYSAPLNGTMRIWGRGRVGPGN